jgi:D-tyrosyl-tRNA(Tyr) deacylase
MRAVVQRVSTASVFSDGEMLGSISEGLVVLLGVKRGDTESEAAWLAEKIVHLRIFADAFGKMNCSLADIGGEMLIVSQFTLYGDCRKGRRPVYSDAAAPVEAEPLYERFIDWVKKQGIRTASGQFQAMMQVALTNDGPVTLLVDTDQSPQLNRK